MPLSEEQVRAISDKILDGHYVVEESVRMIADAVLELAAKEVEVAIARHDADGTNCRAVGFCDCFGVTCLENIRDRIRSMKSGGA